MMRDSNPHTGLVFVDGLKLAVDATQFQTSVFQRISWIELSQPPFMQTRSIVEGISLELGDFTPFSGPVGIRDNEHCHVYPGNIPSVIASMGWEILTDPTHDGASIINALRRTVKCRPEHVVPQGNCVPIPFNSPTNYYPCTYTGVVYYIPLFCFQLIVGETVYFLQVNS